jgi:hypothetical protein
MSYTHIEYYESGNLKSIQVSGLFVSFEASLKDIVLNSPANLKEVKK